MSVNGNSKGGSSDNAVLAKIPPPLNPGDPLNQFVYSLGGRDEGDRFETLPGIDGIPHRAKGVRFYKNDDPAHLRPQSGGQVRCEMFNTGNEKEKLAYQIVASRLYTMAIQGKAVITAVERHFDPNSGGMKVYLEWIERYTYDNGSPRSHSNAEPGILRRS